MRDSGLQKALAGTTFAEKDVIVLYRFHSDVGATRIRI